ncbi:MAG: hypothetical protein ABJO57_10140 [Lentilitoribacter sp.]
MTIDIFHSSVQDQRDIKEVCRLVKNQRGMQYHQLFDKMELDVGTGYESTLAKGAAAPSKVFKIYQWLIIHELDLASKAKPHLFESSMQTGWQSFIDERGIYHRLLSKPYDTLQLHDISNQNPLRDIRLKLGQQFTFELDSPVSGAVIALDCYKNKWFPLPLSTSDGFAPVTVSAGCYEFPRQTSGGVVQPLRQRRFAGEHSHCFITGPNDLMIYYSRSFAAGRELSPSFLEAMANRLSKCSASKLSVCLEHILFE